MQRPIASASVTELLQGRTLGAALTLGADEVEAALGGLPASRKHCAEHAARAARRAADSLSGCANDA
ncbi:MAG: iron-sulfur cluster assembly scaffold protein [Chloroflexia bacterium]